MAGAWQLRLLLWKDYLIRKRKPITLAGVAWATLVVLSLYAVRINIDNKDYSTCQFAARALPSAGVLNFLQSFVCNVNNECSPMDQFEEIPAYSKSTFTQLQRELSPLIDNETVVDVVSSAPDALKLLATLADVADNQMLVDVLKNGLKVADLFRNPKRVKRYLTQALDIPEEVANSIITADIGFDGIVQGKFDRCNVNSLKKVLKVENVDHLTLFANKLCELDNQMVQNLVMELLLQIDFGKYITMAGDMYSKLDGDNRITKIGNMLEAVLKMTSLDNFLPLELVGIIKGQKPEFSYLNMTIITKIIDSFQPTFGETESYKSIKEFADTLVLGLRYLHNILVKKTEDGEVTDLALKDIGKMDTNSGFKRVSQIFSNIANSVTELGDSSKSIKIFDILSGLTNFIFKWLPDNTKSDILFYSTLLGKLIEGADKVVNINMHVEQLAYNVSLRNPKGVKVLLGLKPDLIEKGLEALVDAERTQILTSKINDPGQIFCDTNRLKIFFLISREEATNLKTQLCTDAWDNYIQDLISSFGIYDVKNNINSMASLFILSTLGQDISDQLYSVDKDFEIVKDFTEHIKEIELEEKPVINWKPIFNKADSDVLKIFRKKAYLGKHMLITVHGALAKEVVSQNPLLEYKIAPILKKIIVMINAMNEQLDVAPKDLQIKAKQLYPEIVLTILNTAMDEEKSYKALSTSCQGMLCHGLEEASKYLNFPENINQDYLVTTMCNITKAIDEGLEKESIIGKAIAQIKNASYSPLEGINWTKLITDLNNLYEKLNNDYTYLFEYKTFGMDEDMQKKVMMMTKEVKEFWFNVQNLSRGLHVSIKLSLRVLDLLDRGIFNIQDESWIKLKFSLASTTGPMVVVDDLIQLIAGIATNNSYTSNVPLKTALTLQNILPNLPPLIIDVVDLVKGDNTDINPIISILNSETPWPCSSTSLTEILQLSEVSQTAVKSLETLMCFNGEMRTEWRRYLDERNVTMFNTKTWNTTIYPENVFLRFSAAFDSILKDFDSINEIIQIAFDEDVEGGQVTFMSSLRYMVDVFNGTDGDVILRSFFNKLDSVLNSINTTNFDTISLHLLWREYLNCSEDCQMIGRATWKYTLEFLSVVGGNVTEDLFVYFKESNEPNTTFIQLLGFTRNTGLYMLYDKLPDFIAVLINSYFDLGFLNQIRRASLTHFWDCDEVLSSLNPGPYSPIDMAAIKLVQPIICPSFLYWISMPRGDNRLIDLFTKPQYQFFTLEAGNLSSTYEKAYANANDLTNILNDISKKNITKPFNFDLNILKEKLESAIDSVISYRIKDTDRHYQSFSEANKKYSATSVYLTKVVTIINKLVTELDNLNITEVDSDPENVKNLESELSILQKIFKRRPSEAIAFHFDVITDVLTNKNKDYKMTDALEDICARSKTKDHLKDILAESDRVKIQICAKKYDIFYKALQHVLDDDSVDARKSLESLVKIYKEQNDNVTDPFTFLKESKKIVEALRTSIKYSYDLGIPIYLKYLQDNLKHYDVILSFLSGDNWWEELRGIYNGPKAKNFFYTVEKGFDIAEDVLTHLDKIHLIRLLRDVNINSTDAFCQTNVTLADYVPDSTGLLSAMHRQMCDIDTTELFKELPPLLFASQGYDNNLKMSDEIDYITLYSDISNTESKLEVIKDGPQSPLRPLWVTEENLKMLKDMVMQLLSKESLIKISFGIVSNVVDAGTLFINNSQCTLCSQFTSWIKQLNLQLYKKQEYDNLLCSLDSASQHSFSTLNNDFHWDMAISELISTRNYTKYELNKSLNELLEQIKLHLLEDMSVKSTKLVDCLANNLTGNAFGHAALFVKVAARTTKLLRSYLPYLQEVPGITDLPYLNQLKANIAHNLNVKDKLYKYLINYEQMSKHLVKVIKDKKLIDRVKNAEIDLVQLKDLKPTDAAILIQDYPWEEICKKYDCKEIIATIKKHVNVTLVDLNLPKLQAKEYWQFSFLSKILIHVEATVDHIGRMLGIVSKVDLEGVKEGKLAAVLDTGLQILMDDTMESILYSVLGLVKELHPILNGTALEFDITAVTDGLMIIRQFKNYIIDEDFKVNVSQIFSNPEIMELSLNNLGINNTNFWSIAAPRIRAGYITIKPLLTQKQGTYHISDFVCQTDNMSKIIIPGNVDVVTLEDIYGAVSEQFCDMDDEQARSIIPILVENLNFETIIDKLKSFLLTKLFAASNLTQTEGDTVLSQFSTMAALIPELQGSFNNISEKLSNEPLLKRMKKSLSVGDMLASSDFLTDAGNMLCGKPFYTDISRFYKAIAQNADLTSKPDRAQLEALPTDFCRSLYKDIISMEGGKIVWSFIKPLIVGKILYTPANPAVQKIIEQANSTFVPMAKVVNIIHSFANSFSSVDKLTQHKDGLVALQNLITSPQYSEIRKSLIGEIQAGNFDIDGVFDSFGDTQAIGGIVKKASDLLHCINLDRFKPASNEHDLTLEAARLAMINEFSAGLVFLNMSDSESEIPSKIEYKIRMDIDNAPTTKRIKNYLWTPGPESSFLENMRYFRGFVQLQDIVDKAIIELSMENSSRIQKREMKEENEIDWAVFTQEEPYPCYRKDFFQTSLYESQSLIVAFFFSLLFTVSSAVRFIVSDKETGNTMLMSVMGVNLSYHTLSWFVWSLVELVVTVACITVVLCCGRVLPRSDPSLIFVMLLIFGFSVLAFCYMMSTLFRSASSAAVCTGIAYLITFMPFVLILSLEAVLSSHLKIFVSLSMSSSLCYGFLFIARFEAMGIGAGWSQIWEAPDNTSDMNIAIAAVMVFVDGVVYLIIGYIINRFYGIKSESNITNCHTTGEKAGVSIINVTKIYDEGTRRAKMALDNVSMELQKGQITTLLGHNGAGKTTLIKILTGMLKPTKGHVIVRSDDVNGTGLGVCPQKDVLFEYMTAREHIALYAQLKSGLSLEEVQDEVDSMLRVLCLGPICDTVVARLSGGTRRRLCVALAFVARPRLVSLDEPTAGVDPAARRDIWSMIMKLRENRTILLTTHHLDEAELLSDQIVIMHKGQIHTTGTPIEIKRTLGTGYKLTVVYPDKRLHHLEYTDNEEVSIEEKTKNLLAVARSVVKNANVVDVSGLEVEINLPFFDTDGVSNNFMELCSALEQQRDALAYRSMSLDCSSLEQVFYTVCQQLDGEISSIPESTSKSASTSSIKNDNVPLVSPEGVLKGSAWQQFVALLYARYLHYLRNRWLLFLLIVLPSLFITVAMGFSTIRPPADAEVSLQLYPEMYEEATQYIIPKPTKYSKNIDSSFAQHILDKLRYDRDYRNWTSEDSPTCRCIDAIQQCDIDHELEWNRPQMMVLPDVNTLNDWIIDSHDVYIEKRYGGFSAVLQNNVTHLVAWYNNKGHHALPAFLNALNTAILRVVSGNSDASIQVYTHPLKISKEILNKDSVYQHIADAGISGMLLIAYALASAGGAVYLVTSRRSQEKRLQLLCGVTPLLYCTTALLWDMAIIMINLVITAIVLEIFHFPVFVARNNLPAICILILLYGYGCANLVHVAEKAFTEASLANMLLFCGNAFIGLSGITLLLILDVISDSDETDHARWVLHKILLLSPQFALGDGLLEIAKNTIQAEVLSQFGMDTYRDPLRENVVGYHYIALVLVGTLLFVINLAIEYDCFEVILARFRSKSKAIDLEVEPSEVSAEETRVRASLQPLRLRTIGNINAGFVDSENIIIKNGSLKRSTSVVEDICACVRLRKVYGARCALHGLTLGIPPGQCTALLGENGAGKSTTFSMLTGQLRPTSGQIYLHGRKVTARDLCEGLISYCPQSDALDPLMTVRETLVLYCRLRGIDNRDEVIRRTIEAFELTKYRDVRTGALSGGNKRKLCAAVAFMGRAPLVLLDEPTSGMDPLSRACVSRCVRSAVHSHRGALLATHALEDARRLAARVALLKEGRLVALAPLDECLRRFGGGYIVACRVRRGSARLVWMRIHARAPHASLRVLHHAALHFLLPTHATVEGKEIITNLSDIFRLLAEMQMSCDIEDYTVNQSSLDQMFLNFTERTSILDPADEHPTPRLTRRYSEELDSVTSL